MSLQTPNAAQTQTKSSTADLETAIKQVYRSLYSVQEHVPIFEPSHQDNLNAQVVGLVSSLKDLQVQARASASSDLRVAPDILDYVDSGRNPDIYTRDMVEAVNRGNSIINGKQAAFRDFSAIFAKDLKQAFPEAASEVDSIMEQVDMADR